MKNNCKLLSLLVLLLLLCTSNSKAQGLVDALKQPDKWYVGVNGGVSFGVSSFNSFGEANTRGGFNSGVLGGYQISSVLSAEFSAVFGTVKMGTNKCCSDYFLGIDGNRYLSSVAGMPSYSYNDIYSSVFIQQYVLKLNADLFHIFLPNSFERWSIFISPKVIGIGSTATIKTIKGHNKVYEADAQFNFGTGGDISVGYKLTKQIELRLSSGINFIMGKHFDGLPAGDHNDNLIWDNNISVIWRFGN